MSLSRNLKVSFKVNSRPFRKSLDEFGVEHGFVDAEEAEVRALGRTLEEIDELADVSDRLARPEAAD